MNSSAPGDLKSLFYMLEAEVPAKSNRSMLVLLPEDRSKREKRLVL
jgi:hypothetical protein